MSSAYCSVAFVFIDLLISSEVSKSATVIDMFYIMGLSPSGSSTVVALEASTLFYCCFPCAMPEF
jgi:hypothetical protein